MQEHVFGQDPLEGHEQLKLLRERDFYLHMPSMEELFENVQYSDGLPFKQAVRHFFSLTQSFVTLLQNYFMCCPPSPLVLLTFFKMTFSPFK